MLRLLLPTVSTTEVDRLSGTCLVAHLVATGFGFGRPSQRDNRRKQYKLKEMKLAQAYIKVMELAPKGSVQVCVLEHTGTGPLTRLIKPIQPSATTRRG